MLTRHAPFLLHYIENVFALILHIQHGDKLAWIKSMQNVTNWEFNFDHVLLLLSVTIFRERQPSLNFYQEPIKKIKGSAITNLEICYPKFRTDRQTNRHYEILNATPSLPLTSRYGKVCSEVRAWITGNN